jgi:hypothetical protein
MHDLKNFACYIHKMHLNNESYMHMVSSHKRMGQSFKNGQRKREIPDFGRTNLQIHLKSVTNIITDCTVFVTTVQTDNQ